MKYLKEILCVLLLFFAGCYLAFYFELSFRQQIRELFAFFTNDAISFKKPRGKYFHFPSDAFVSSLGMFFPILFLLVRRMNIKNSVVNLVLVIVLFFTFLIIWCYVESWMKIVECTTCNDGRRILNFDEINFDRIFICSLAFSLIPLFIQSAKKYLNAAKRI